MKEKDKYNYDLCEQFSFHFDDVNDDQFHEDDATSLCNSSSLNNLASSIARYMEDGSNSNSIIGLTGNFGSGKTFFCKYLEEYLNKSESKELKSSNTCCNEKKHYYFVYYNLWSHQNDPIKESILRKITFSLLSNKVLKNQKLKNNKTINNELTNENDIDSWLSENGIGLLKNNLKKTITPIKNKAYIIAALIALIALLNQITSILRDLGLIEALKKWFTNICDIEISFKLLLIAITCILIFFLFYVIVSIFGGDKFEIGYSKDGTGRTTIEDTNKKDLSSFDFQNWLHELISRIDEGKRVVVVLDNIDRLPLRFVENFFASIHEVFSRYEHSLQDKKNNFFVIIPFDYLHIYQEFSNSSRDILSLFLSEDKNSEILKNKFTKVSNDSQDAIEKTNDIGIKNPFGQHDYVMNLNKTEDILNKTFSVIFYLPHINPYSFKNNFVRKCNNVIACWQKSTLNKKIDKIYLQEANQIANYCWEIFLSVCKTESFTPRRLNSFIKEFAVLFQINAYNFDLYSDVPPNKIPLFFAVYAANVSLFRTNCFVLALNHINEAYKDKKYGIYRSNVAEDGLTQELFYTSLEMIYHQTTVESLYGDDFYFLSTLIEGFENKNIYIIKSRLSRGYFYEKTVRALDVLLNSFSNLDYIVEVFEILHNDNFFSNRKIKSSEQIWKDIYCSLIKALSAFLSKGNVLEKKRYELLENVLLNNLKNEEESIVLLASYYRDVICKMAKLSISLHFIVNSFTFFVKNLSELASLFDKLYNKSLLIDSEDNLGSYNVELKNDVVTRKIMNGTSLNRIIQS